MGSRRGGNGLTKVRGIFDWDDDWLGDADHDEERDDD